MATVGPRTDYEIDLLLGLSDEDIRSGIAYAQTRMLIAQQHCDILSESDWRRDLELLTDELARRALGLDGGVKEEAVLRAFLGGDGEK
jgi:hypothetical protein